MFNLTVGCDPEFFLVHEDTGIPESAHNLIPGSKDEPYPVDCGAIQADGTAVEFNIHPAHTPQEFANNIATVLRQLREMVPQQYRFYLFPSVKYSTTYFKKLPLFAKELGCDPDFDAQLDGRINPKPKTTGTMRTAAGHIHIGWVEGQVHPNEPFHFRDCIQAVQQLDRVLFKLEPLWCQDTTRRELYGKPGAFRPKPYGVEYRVLSNAWLRYPKLWPWLFKMVEQTMEDLHNEELQLSLGDFKYGQWRAANSMLPIRYPKIPLDVQLELKPWEHHS